MELVDSSNSCDVDRRMNLSVICNWEGEKVSLEFLTVFGRPWQYRGEGNANIVLALQDELRVIRLSKVKKGDPLDNWSGQRRKVEREVIFANQIFIPLLGVEYVGFVQAVQIASDQIQMLNNCLTQVRPKYRQHKELRVPYATAHRDFARIHPYPSRRIDYCVEIKPKQGWWPKHLKNGKEDHKLCTYCLNQFLKLERSKIANRTEYCPLDLFSGRPERMIEAIVALISNPQNNLRIFRDGRLVYGENMCESLDLILTEWIGNDSNSFDFDTTNKSQESLSAKSNLVFLLCLALLKPKRVPPTQLQVLNERYEKLKGQIESTLLNYNSRAVPKDPPCLRSCTDSPSPLPEGCILSRILEIQKLADISGGVDQVYSFYRKICPVHSVRREVQKKCSQFVQMCPWDQISPPELPLSLPLELELPLPHMTRVRSRSLQSFPTNDESGSEELESLDSMEEVSTESGDFSTDSTDSNDEETLKEEWPLMLCPGQHCLSEEKWLDEIIDPLDPVDPQLTKEEVKSIEHYLLAATAKDCSIMITFSPVGGARAKELQGEAAAESMRVCSPTSPSIFSYEESDLILQDLRGMFHRVRIGVADLDPKPVSCIVKHFLRDCEMIKDFREFLRVGESNSSNGGNKGL